MSLPIGPGLKKVIDFQRTITRLIAKAEYGEAIFYKRILIQYQPAIIMIGQVFHIGLEQP